MEEFDGADSAAQEADTAAHEAMEEEQAQYEPIEELDQAEVDDSPELQEQQFPSDPDDEVPF
jgi:hypothetical protein